jgi:maleylpyruvate isomerase
VTTLMNRRSGAPPMTLTRPAAVTIGTTVPVEVTGPPAAMLAWLSGRSDGSGLHPDPAALPAIPPLA